MITEAEARAALDGVIHPSFGMSLITLGMVRGIRIQDSLVEVDLVMNCPGCPAGEAALALARRCLQVLAGDVPIRFYLLPEAWVPPWQ
jgi:metal-sulfur cluster biosynthetic enzyme